MRADRLLSILLLLQSHPRLTTRELAERLEVSTRTIHRDMEALGAAGVPVFAERGANGGWALVDGYRTNLTGLNSAEIQTLFVAKPARLLTDLGLDRAAEAARLKLLAAMPSASRQAAADTADRILVDGTRWNTRADDVPFLPILQAALWQEHRLRLLYERGDGTTVERVVDPLGLVAKGSVWYFVAAVAGELRTYRVSRVRDAALVDEIAARPPDFDLAAFWEQSSQEFRAALPRYPLRLRATPGAVARLRTLGRYSTVEHVAPADDDGWCEVAMRFELERDAREALLSLGPAIEVLEPAELRAAMVTAAEQLLALYSREPSTTTHERFEEWQTTTSV